MNALIVDDEFMPAEYLEQLLIRHCPEIKQISICLESKETLKHLNTHKVDVLFLDIEMPDFTGFDLIEMIPKEKIPAIIFTTAYHKYATKAFEVSAIHYLLKPIDPEKLKNAVERVSNNGHRIGQDVSKSIQRIRQLDETISLADGQDYHIVAI